MLAAVTRTIALAAALLSTALLMTALSATPARADVGDFRFTRVDHQAHMAVSYGLALTGTLILEHEIGLERHEAVLASSLTTLAIGLIKELVIDDAGDSSDLLANVIGIGAAAGIVFGFRF